MTKQFNVELPSGAIERVKIDAVKMGVSLNEYALQVFEQFLTKPICSRRVYFDSAKQKKTSGRKISTQ
jgi:hypothetical protein